jgi:hypothetical protein
MAQKVIEEYQNSSCQELAEEKRRPPTVQRAQMEQRAVEILRNDAGARAEFLNRVAAPIAIRI